MESIRQVNSDDSVGDSEERGALAGADGEEAIELDDGGRSGRGRSQIRRSLEYPRYFSHACARASTKHRQTTCGHVTTATGSGVVAIRGSDTREPVAIVCAVAIVVVGTSGHEHKSRDKICIHLK